MKLGSELDFFIISEAVDDFWSVRGPRSYRTAANW